MDGVVSVAAADQTSFAIKKDGTLWAWGVNSSGVLGNGSTDTPKFPVKVLDDVISVFPFGNYTFAITDDGSLWSWGNNEYGQLGDGTTLNRPTPAKVLDDVVSVSAQNVYGVSIWRHKKHVLAVKSDGTLWAWGDNEYGQIGDGTMVNRHKPVKVMKDVASVASATGVSYAVKKDGTLFGWGNGSWHAFGNGSNENSPVPVEVLRGVSQIVTTDTAHYAVKNDGTLWAWGNDNYGELAGDSRAEPFKLMEGVSSVLAKGTSVFAIRKDDSLWAWGGNNTGQLGNGSHEDQDAPTRILDNVQSVISDGFSYEYRTVAVKQDGSVWAWGDNESGQVGDGTRTDRHEPVKVMDGSGDLPEKPTLLDSDGDGLPDEWETADAEEASKLGIPCIKEMGADPYKPDIFVETDWAETPSSFFGFIGGKSYQPSDSQMLIVAESFAQAPVQTRNEITGEINTGINLHIDSGATSTDYVTGRKWGDLSRANSVGEVKPGDLKVLDGDWTKILSVINTKESNGQLNFTHERATVFHYALFVDRLTTWPNSTSGIAHAGLSGNSIGGKYFMVAKGVLPEAKGEKVNAEAGTFMHELGHNLGLRHGGGDNLNYKPNYRSIMNYFYQFTGLLSSGNSSEQSFHGINYSDTELPDLDENNLDETKGVDPSVDGAAPLYSGRNASIKYKGFLGINSKVDDIAGRSIDWNGNRSSSDKALKHDISGRDGLTKLAGFDDWSHIDYRGGIAARGDSIQDESTLCDELTVDEAIREGLLFGVWDSGYHACRPI